MEALVTELEAHLSHPERLLRGVSLRSLTTLRVGGAADYYYRATTAEELAQVSAAAQKLAVPYSVLGLGSNVLISDAGVRGLVIHAACSRMRVGPLTTVECGAPLQDLFLAAAQAGLTGLEFAVGIPGTVGGALVSNAGAYQASIGGLVETVDVSEGGRRRTVGPEWMEFSYRDSCLRQGKREAVLLAVALNLRPGRPADIYALARECQSRRRPVQPPGPSAGSFFKNVSDAGLVARLPGLREDLREAEVVPAGYLIMEAGLKGATEGGAVVSRKHANFLMNRGDATAADLRRLASRVKRVVVDRFGVTLQEEVLYFGDWSGFDEG
jgi:UDP-N-acetylmuramate dehydrogenase